MSFTTFTRATLKMFFRNKRAIFWTLFFPLVIMIIFGLLNFGGFGSARLGLVDEAQNDASAGLLETLRAIDLLEITEGTRAEERAALSDGERDLVLVIPSSFSDRGEEPLALPLVVNAERTQAVEAGRAIVREVLEGSTRAITNTPPLFTLAEETINARNLSYIDFLVPGVVAMAIMQLGIFSVVFQVVTYKEKGIMRRLFVTPMPSSHFVGGIVFARMVVSALQTGILLAIALLFFGVTMGGSYLSLALFVIIGSLVFLAIGFAISGFADTEESAAPVANLITFPMMFLGNVFFPIESMPDWIQAWAVYLPINYLAEGIRAIMNSGASLGEVSGDLIGLTLWTVATFAIAVFSFRMRRAED